MQLAYYDGVATTTTFSAVTLTIQGVSAFTTTAKHFTNAGSDPYYEGGTTSPNFPNGLVAGNNGSDVYQKMTLVFCIHPNEYADGDIFGSTSNNFYLNMSDTSGSLLLGWRDFLNTQRNIAVAASGSPTDGGVWPKDQWNAVMIVLDSDSSTSPETKNIKVWSNGVELFNATHPGRASHNPMGYAGPVWVGKGDGWPTIDHYLSYVWCKEEALDPATYWSSFFDGSNKPLDIGADGSSVTGSQPDTYCPDADFTNNLGFGPNWTESGTVPAAPSSPTD